MPIYRVPADISELQIARQTIVLRADVAAGATTLSVQDIGTVAVNQFLLLRGVGNDRAEIVTTHASTSPSGTTITLTAAGTKYAHPAGTIAYVIPFNQIRFFHSASEVDANADAASLSALAAASNIDVTEARNYYNDTVQTSGFYYWRFSDSVNSVNGLYSDAIPWGQFEVEWEEDEVGNIAETVRKEYHREWNDRFSFRDALKSANRCLEYMQEELNHWSQYLEPDYEMGQTALGVHSFALPSDIFDNTSNRSILNVRLEGLIDPLIYVDEKEFDTLMDDAVVTQVRTVATIGATTLAIDNSFSFGDSGTVHVYTSNTDDAITYTGVTRSATVGILTGVPTSGDGAIGAAHAVDLNVWQNPDEGRPRYWTIKDGRLYIWPLPDSQYINLNVLIDYYREATRVNSGSDRIDADRYLAVYYWLRWNAWAVWFNDGKLDTNNDDFKLFQNRLSKRIRNTKSGQKFKWKPKLGGITYTPKRRARFIDS